MLNQIKVSENFYLLEFQSPDTQEVKVEPELIRKVQELRDLVGQPLILNSAYRTKERNEETGGADNSYHLKGMAVDVRIPDGYTVDEIANLGKQVGFRGIGRYYSKNFCHFDIRKSDRVVEWQELK